MEGILYKYLDAEGGAAMLYNKNLMFTNATQLNDPFDCHQNLIDFSNSRTPRVLVFDETVLVPQEVKWCESARDKTWICSLSKVYDSLLMWAFYGNNHQGMCIGIDMVKAKQYLDKMDGFFNGCLSFEVQYRNIQNRPDYYSDKEDYFTYQFATKAREWAHEQEVRLVTIDPSPKYMKLMPGQNDEKGPVDWRKVHAFTDLEGECFASLYFGVNMERSKRDKIIGFAKQVNPYIIKYQMEPDPKAFKLTRRIIY